MFFKRKISKKIKKITGTYRETIEELRARGLKIGDNVDILNSNIDSDHGFLISIGNNVTITNATLLAHDASTYKFLGKSKIGRIEIGDNVFIGLGAIILPNTQIGSNVIIGAGAVVSGKVEDNSVMAGNPARKICTCEEYINKHKLKMKDAPVFDTPIGPKSKQDQLYIDGKIKIGEIGYDN